MRFVLSYSEAKAVMQQLQQKTAEQPATFDYAGKIVHCELLEIHKKLHTSTHMVKAKHTLTLTPAQACAMMLAFGFRASEQYEVIAVNQITSEIGKIL